ncbi:MAG: hypothetical protein WC378_13560 [Opitutaceae bacterium]|jgi:hypothetical protein
MDAFINAFNATWDAMPTARAQIRVGGHDVIPKALCSGIDLARKGSDQGPFDQGQITVRCLASSETAKITLPKGAKIEVNCLSQGGDWVPLRIARRADRAGIIILNVEDPNE